MLYNNKKFSKAETLKLINIKLKNSLKIPKFFFFEKKQFLLNKEKIVKKIIFQFNKKVIIRSSSRKEDNSNYSNAGKYLSILNIDPTNQFKLVESINRISEQLSNRDQIIVQEFLSNCKKSGVIFTKDKNTNAPYYFINYDTSGKTDLVTSGVKNINIVNRVVYKNYYKKNKFSKIISKAKLLEKFFQDNRLDIEFAINNKNKFYLFQCRTLYKNRLLANNERINIDEYLINIEKKINHLKVKNPFLSGKSTLFSNMSDWNPAEMIGTKPKSLGLSLYKELITDKIWSEQRSLYGYKDVKPNKLLINLGGSPYIDLRTDLNSFLPKNLKKELEKKIINKCLYLVNKNKKLHDSIEFKVIPTCYYFGIEKDLKKFNLLVNEEKDYIDKLKKLTIEIINNKFYLENQIRQNKKLKKIIERISSSKMNEISKIYFIIENCKKYGTLPFAGIARCAFIGKQILDSLINIDLISNSDANNFYNSINSISSKLNKDLNNLTTKEFNKKYGHLRPNTYSISSLNYKENFNNYFRKKNLFKTKNYKKYKIDKKILKLFNTAFKKKNLEIKSERFFEFVEKSIVNRELSKFIFSKAIDEIFKNLITFGKKINIKRNDFEFVPINMILDSYNNLSLSKLEILLKKEIVQNKKKHKILNLISLPDVISNKEDIYYYEEILKNGNYITQNKIVGKTKYLKYNTNKNISNLKDKIIIIENADPGFDYIFTYGIKGLITKYGGANSHMAIRCLEMNIPAIIGIGQKKYSEIMKSNILSIDCMQKNYLIIS